MKSGAEGSPEGQDLAELTSAHRHLSGLVHPARPQTILRITEERCRWKFLLFFGPLPIVRRLVFGSIALLVAFVLFASSDSVRSSTSNPNRTGAAVTTTTTTP